MLSQAARRVGRSGRGVAGAWARAAAALALLAALAACEALPRSGPLASQIDREEAEGALEGLVAPLTAEVAARVSSPPPRRFPEPFLAARPLDPDLLGPGDVLAVTVWEAGGLFDGGTVSLPGLTVDPGGAVHVPYAGSIRAAGTTVGALRGRIAAALAPLTLDPQVDVRLLEPRSRTVTVQGAVGAPGIYPLDRPALRLAPLLARAGGSPLPPEQVEVSVRRDGAIGRAMLEDLYDDPALDIALRSGDVVVATPIRERFVALGATSRQAEIAFPSRDLSLMSALGAAQGLRDFDADPTGVFVFRREPRALADALLPGPPPEGLPVGATRPVVYRLDLTEPGAFFIAQNFRMRDGDALFATNAPLTEMRKFVQLFTSVLTPVQQGAVIAP